MSQNAITPDGCKIIKDLISSNETLEHLILNHVAMSDEGGSIIANSIKNLKLKSFEAEKNRFKLATKDFNNTISNDIMMLNL